MEPCLNCTQHEPVAAVVVVGVVVVVIVVSTVNIIQMHTCQNIIKHISINSKNLPAYNQV